jgi:hypothetical protein
MDLPPVAVLRFPADTAGFFFSLLDASALRSSLRRAGETYILNIDFRKPTSPIVSVVLSFLCCFFVSMFALYNANARC